MWWRCLEKVDKFHHSIHNLFVLFWKSRTEWWIMQGAPSVGMDTTSFILIPLCANISFIAKSVSSPLVCVVSAVMPKMSSQKSFLSAWSNLTYTKSWALSLISVDSSTTEALQGALLIAAASCDWTSSPNVYVRLVAERGICWVFCQLSVHVFLFHPEVFRAQRSCSSTMLPSVKGFLCCPKIHCILSEHSYVRYWAERDWERTHVDHSYWALSSFIVRVLASDCCGYESSKCLCLVS